MVELFVSSAQDGLTNQKQVANQENRTESESELSLKEIYHNQSMQSKGNHDHNVATRILPIGMREQIRYFEGNKSF